jgi:hypothetical protein
MQAFLIEVIYVLICTVLFDDKNLGTKLQDLI